MTRSGAPGWTPIGASPFPAFRQCEETGRIRNFEVADSVNAGLISTGTFCSRHGYDDSDVFKIIEGAAYSLHTYYDAVLDRYLDGLIAKIARAQEPDGYLHTMYTIQGHLELLVAGVPGAFRGRAEVSDPAIGEAFGGRLFGRAAGLHPVL